MSFTGVYPIIEPIFAGPKKFAPVPRYGLWLPGLLPEAQEAASVLLNVSQTRAEEDIWVWISRDYLLNALHQDILACDKERIGLQLTDTYQMPKRTRGGGRFLDWITRGAYTLRHLGKMKTLKRPRPLSADRGEPFFIQGLQELMHGGLAKRLPRTINGDNVVFYAPTARLVGMLAQWETSQSIHPQYSS